MRLLRIRTSEGVSIFTSVRDMIETYKIGLVTGKYEEHVAPALAKVSNYVTRGNDSRLMKSRSKYDLRKYSFTSRIVNIWNSLPNWVVSANTTNTFKIDWIGFGRIRK